MQRESFLGMLKAGEQRKASLLPPKGNDDG